MKHSILCGTIGLTALLLAAPTAWPLADEQAANIWKPLGDGAFALPDKGYPSLNGSGFLWLPDRDLGLVAPLLTEAEARANPGYRKLSFNEPKWTFVPGKSPAGLIPDMWDSPRGYVYLPGLKKVLFVKQEWSFTPKKQPVTGWLLDPADGSWEPLLGAQSMSDRSADFQPAECKEGLRLPIWGAACYDPVNQEAVCFGGGGTWGRVGKEKEAVAPGDWYFDEQAKRIRRRTPDSPAPGEARKWYPGHCGTWTFSEAGKKWTATSQPLGQQPSGRILPGMAYDAGAQKIVLFGGDDLARCLGDTWVYDCKTRTWSQQKPRVAPEPRAGHALIYVPDQKVVLLAGGYAGGWRPLKDVWAYDTTRNEWQQLSCELPAASGHASGDYDPKRKLVVLLAYPATRGNRTAPVYTLKLDLAKATGGKSVASDPKLAYHCKGKAWTSDLPDEWLTGSGAPEKPETVLARIQALPANSWHDMNPPKKARERTWGIYLYDPKSRTGFAWGGGHSGYPGAEITEYDLATNRWRGMTDPTNYNPVWLHGMVGGPPGISFGGWSLLPSHARKSYGIDPLSGSVITYAGDVYSMKHHQFTDHIGNFPIEWGGPSYQVAYATTPHGLYGYAATYGSKGTGWLCKANVAGGVWDVLSKDGPGGHFEYDFLVHDSRRDRLLYFKYKPSAVWAFDFKTRKWTQEEVTGKQPPLVMGDGTYIPEMDAVLTMFPDEPKGPEKFYFYQCSERKWYTAPSVGDPFRGVNTAKDYSPIYDPELGIVVRITQCGFAAHVNVHVMRLEPAKLKLTAIE
ncbi:MAG: hypothetical protein JNM56_14245 [Planctomycetia bacterium]|nr:hypothetical protein [Planctomycetia bacterium]